MKTSPILFTFLALLFVIPLAQAQGTAQPVAQAAAKYTQPKLEQFANAYRSIVILSQEYAPKLKAAADIQAAEAINQEAQGKMVSAIQDAGLSKEEYQQIATSLKSDPSLVERVNKILQEKSAQD
jgi:GTP1/Obg family GTP-binding protein